MLPSMYVAVDEETNTQLQQLIDALEDDEDVNDVYHNADFS